VLLEAEKEVAPPISVSHIQWLDMHDWQKREAEGPVAWEQWYREKFNEILALLASPNVKNFAGEIAELEQHLQPISQATDIDPLVNGFVGREWLMAGVDQWRKQNIDSRLLWISGGPGSGKSAFAAWLAHYGKLNVIGLNLCRYNIDERRDAGRVLGTLAFQIATRVPVFRLNLLRILRSQPRGKENEAKTPAQLFDRLLARPLHQGIDGGQRNDRFLVVIDALDESIVDGHSALGEVLAERAHTLPAWLAIVVTSRPEEPINRLFAGLKPQRIVADAAENVDDLRRYLSNWQAKSNNLTGLIDQILKASAGNFLYVRKVTEGIQEGLIDPSLIENFPPGLTGIYEIWFRRLFPDGTAYLEFVPLLQVLVAAEHPVPERFLTILFGWSAQRCALMVARISSLFELRPEGVAPFHKSLRDWLIDAHASGMFAIDPTEGTQRLAVALWETFIDWAKQKNKPVLDLFCLHEFPSQLSKMKTNEFLKLLGDGAIWPDVAPSLIKVATAQASAFAWERAAQWWQIITVLAGHVGQKADHDRAHALEQIGDMLSIQGHVERALNVYKEVALIRERVADSNQNNASWQSELAQTYTRLASAYSAMFGLKSSYHDSKKSLDKALGILRRLNRIDPNNIEWARELAHCHINAGELVLGVDDKKEAMKSFQASLAVAEKMQDCVDREISRVSAYRAIGSLQVQQADLNGAFKSFNDGLAINENLVKADPDNAKLQQGLAVGRVYVGDIERRRKNIQEAIKCYRVACSTFERVAKLQPEDLSAQINLSNTHISIAQTYDDEHKHLEALSEIRASVQISEALVELDPSNVAWQSNLATCYGHMGGLQGALRNNSESLKYFRMSLKIKEKAASVDPNDFVLQRQLAEGYENLTLIQDIMGDIDAAVSSYAKSIEIQERMFKARPENLSLQQGVLDTQEKLGDFQLKHSKFEGAIKTLRARQSIIEDMIQRSSIPDVWRVALAKNYESLAGAYFGMKNFQESLAVLREARRLVAGAEKDAPPGAVAHFDQIIQHVERESGLKKGWWSW
jgi:tetratricopeptide (TPR) repeat protein